MSDLRQQVRRDDDLPPMARLLFAEIWQMNEGDGQCYAEDEWLGNQIGAAESTVRRHRLTLRQKGYIKQSKSGGKRYLEPNEMINIDQSDQNQSESTGTADQSDQNRSEKVINSDQHRGSNNPEGTSSRARVHEESSPSTPEDRFEKLIDIWRSTSTTPPLTRNAEDVLWDWAQDAVVKNYDRFRRILQQDASSVKGKGSGFDFGVLQSKLQDARSDGEGGHTVTQEPNPNGIRDKNGRHLRRTPEFVN